MSETCSNLRTDMVIAAIIRDVCELPGPYDPNDPEVVMLRRDELEGILELRLRYEPADENERLRAENESLRAKTDRLGVPYGVKQTG